MPPTFLYDKDCGFCKRWVKYWKRLTGKSVEYRPFQEAGKDFPQIPQEAYKKSSQFVLANGTVYSGARGIAELLAHAPGKGWFKWWYLHFVPFAMITEFGYRNVSSCRVCAAKASKFFWGDELKPSTFVFTRKLFLRLLGLVYLIAFVSFWVQIPGLIGDNGILPTGEFLDAVETAYGSGAIFKVPTLAWISSSTIFLQFIALAGAGLALLVLIGIQLSPFFFLLWVGYLSLFYAGQTFMSFQWDILLLEVGFLAMFFAPNRFGDKSDPPHLTIWLYRLLVFKLMFSSGFVKLASGDTTWTSLSALDFHYFTQPIPNTIAWFAHQLPTWFQHGGVIMMFVIQLLLPFLIFAPRRLRHFAAFSFIFLELIIAFTGNYTFFNILTIALILLLFDDQFFNRAPARKPKEASKSAMHGARMLAGLILILSVLSIPTSLRIVNSYGLFAVMTTTRQEIILQGSDDGLTWQNYEFKYKPGDIYDPPPFVAPHQPRLDWQMWFAALGTYERNPWFVNLAERLLEAEPDVLKLLSHDPFNGERPAQVRAALYEYEFTTREEYAETGAWWKRTSKGLYLPVATLE